MIVDYSLSYVVRTNMVCVWA